MERHQNVDERMNFVLKSLQEDVNFSELCAEYGICRKTGNKWRGGSETWSHHLAVRIVDATQIRYDDANQPHKHSYRRLELVSHLPNDFFN